MSPKSPRTELKISMTRTLTNLIGLISIQSELHGDAVARRELTETDLQHQPALHYSH